MNFFAGMHLLRFAFVCVQTRLGMKGEIVRYRVSHSFLINRAFISERGSVPVAVLEILRHLYLRASRMNRNSQPGLRFHIGNILVKRISGACRST